MDVKTFQKTAGFHAIQATARAIVDALAQRLPAQAYHGTQVA